MFFRKKKAASRPSPHLVRAEAMASTLLDATGLEFDHANALNQALIGTFLFGMLYAFAMDAKLTMDQACALIVTVYQTTLHYTPDVAAKALQECIDATGPGVHDTMNAIIHRGIDGHRQYGEGDGAGLAENIQSILEHFA